MVRVKKTGSSQETSDNASRTKMEILSQPCCEPVMSGTLDDAEIIELANVLKVLADPARLQLLSIIASSPTGESCVCDLTAPIGKSQGTVSHHLGLLVESGILSREKRGRWSWYRVQPDRLEWIRGALAPHVKVSSC